MAFEDVSVPEDQMSGPGEFYQFKDNGQVLEAYFAGQSKAQSRLPSVKETDHRYTFITKDKILIVDPAPTHLEVSLDRAIRAEKLKMGAKVRMEQTGTKPSTDPAKSGMKLFKVQVDASTATPERVEAIKKKLAGVPAPAAAPPPPPPPPAAINDPFAD
jgi:hypothetical protein